MSRLPAIISVIALIFSQFVHVAVVDAAETHHAMHMEAGLDHHQAPAAPVAPSESGDTHALHDLFHCGGHFAAPSDHQFFGALPAPICRSTGPTEVYLSVATAPPVPPPLT